MKQLLMFMLAISLLTACDSNPFSKKDNKEETADKDDKDKEKSDDDESDDKKSNDDDEKEDDNESNWTSKQRDKWLNECIDAAGKNSNARLLCSCVLEKMEKKYPDSKDAEKVSEATATRLAKECMEEGGNQKVDEGGDDIKTEDDPDDNNGGGNWTSVQRKQFVKGCATSARQAQGFTSQQATAYCECMTQKVERKHTFQEAGRMTAEDFSTEEWQNAAMDCRSKIDD